MNFITKQVEKKIGMDLNGDGVIGSGRGPQHGNAGGYSQGHGGASGGGGLMNKLESVTHMDLNGDGRVGGGMRQQGQQYNQHGGAGYPPNYNQQGGGYPQSYNQYGGAPGPQNSNQYGGQGYPQNPNQYGGAPGPQNYGQHGGPGYGPNAHQSGGGGGGGLMNKLENVVHMDLNGDGRIGGGQVHPPNNQYGRQY